MKKYIPELVLVIVAVSILLFLRALADGQEPDITPPGIVVPDPLDTSAVQLSSNPLQLPPVSITMQSFTPWCFAMTTGNMYSIVQACTNAQFNGPVTTLDQLLVTNANPMAVTIEDDNPMDFYRVENVIL